MRNKRAHIVVAAISLLWLLVPHVPVSAGSVTVTETCNVLVTFTATVPDSIEQGKSFTVSNITVSPSRSYGFNVTSSVFQMSATNTPSTSYNQDFLSTNPSPTTGHSSYVAYYPNWIINATGSVGSSVVIKLVKTVTTIPGYGGSPVTCVFTKTLATVPIVAAASSPAPSATPTPTPTTTQTPLPTSSPSPIPTQTTSSSPTISPTASPSSTISGGTSSSGSSSTSGSSSATTNGTAGASGGPSTNTSKTPNESTTKRSVNQAVAVVPLSVEVRDSLGGAVKGAVVTLDGSQKLTTDEKGKGTFSNVLTGKHILLVSYKGLTASRDINIDTDNLGSAVAIKLPPSTQPLNFVIPTVLIVVVMSGVLIAIFIRRRHAADAAFVPPATAIPGVIAGSVDSIPKDGTLRPVPPIVVFEPKVVTQNPAPWDLSRAVTESIAQPTVDPAGVSSTAYTQEAQPPAGPQIQVPTLHTQSPLQSKSSSQANSTNGQLNAPI